MPQARYSYQRNPCPILKSELEKQMFCHGAAPWAPYVEIGWCRVACRVAEQTDSVPELHVHADTSFTTSHATTAHQALGYFQDSLLPALLSVLGSVPNLTESCRIFSGFNRAGWCISLVKNRRLKIDGRCGLVLYWKSTFFMSCTV